MGKLSLLLHLLVSSGQTGVRDEQWGSPEEKKAEMLTGTWLERAKVLAGLFFLLLLLLVLPPPELMVLPPDIFRFLRLLGCCRAGSAVPGKRLRWERALDPRSPFPFLRSPRLPCPQSCSPRSKKQNRGNFMEIKDTVSGYAVRAWRGQGQGTHQEVLPCAATSGKGRS